MTRVLHNYAQQENNWDVAEFIFPVSQEDEMIRSASIVSSELPPLSSYACVISFPKGGGGGGIPRSMWGLCGDFEINTSPCRGGHVVK